MPSARLEVFESSDFDRYSDCSNSVLFDYLLNVLIKPKQQQESLQCVRGTAGIPAPAHVDLSLKSTKIGPFWRTDPERYGQTKNR